MTSEDEGVATPVLRAPRPHDVAAILELNRANEVETAPLTRAALDALLAMAFRARVHVSRGTADAFLLALDEGAATVSPNFAWFRARYSSFVYVDRIIVSSSVRGRGVGRALYLDLMRAAEASGRAMVCAEVNLDPPNPGSDAFHLSMGFAEVGSGILPGGRKAVRYLSRRP
jgi:predicted GNAT superfamily acetyltransferase